MNETKKSKLIWGELEKSVLRGKGIDIGSGGDPLNMDVIQFDIEQGDANYIGQYVHEQFDFVFSSHCLEHMYDPHKTILEWWKLVKPGGHIFFIVPDEDLYEKGSFPSRLNPDHKATFTLSKAKSWSPVSINVLDLANTLPGGQLVSLVLQDHNYDRTKLVFKRSSDSSRIATGLLSRLKRLVKPLFLFFFESQKIAIWHMLRRDDQTQRSDVLAQIQCIVKKVE